jgi:hypothetical protein
MARLIPISQSMGSAWNDADMPNTEPTLAVSLRPTSLIRASADDPTTTALKIVEPNELDEATSEAPSRTSSGASTQVGAMGGNRLL